MKTFKKIYYPIIAIVTVLVIVLSFLAAYGVGGSTRLDNSFIDRAIGHAEVIVENGERNVMNFRASHEARISVENAILLGGNAPIQYTGAGLTPDGDIAIINLTTRPNSPILAAIDITANSATAASATYRNQRVMHIRTPGNALQNVVVFIPGSQTLAGAERADVALFSVRTDSIGEEATNAAVVGAMIEHVRALLATAATPNHSNDLLFVFADGSLEHDMGLRIILNQLNLRRQSSTATVNRNVIDDVKFIAQFSAEGTAGPVMITHTGIAANETMAKLGQSSAASSSFIELFDMATQDGAHHVAHGIPSLTFANIGGARYQRTDMDNIENLSRNVVVRHAEVMRQVINTFANANLTALQDGNATSAVHFSYGSLFNVSAPSFLEYILAALILLLVIVIIVLNVIKLKSFSLQKAGLGAIAQLVAITVGALAVFVFFALMALLLAGFGVISIHAFVLFSLFNPGILISAIILFSAAAVAVYIPLKRAFFIKSPSVARGGVFVVALLAVLTAFIMPSIAHIFTILSIAQLTVMLITMLVGKKFKEKFGTNIESLFLYLVPTIIALPIVIPAVVFVGALTPLIMLPVLALMIAPLIITMLPYLEMLKPMLAKVFNRLPSQTVKTEEMVTEMVEDEAKKGKFSEQTYKKVSKEKVKWQYKHRYGVILVSIFAFVSLILFSAFGGGFNSKIYSNTPTLENYFRTNSLNYVNDPSATGNTRRLEVYDLSAFREISRPRYAVGEFSFNNALNAYSMSIPADFSVTGPQDPQTETRLFTYRAFSNQSRITVTIFNTQEISEIYIMAEESLAMFDEDRAFKLYNTDNAPQITIVLPFGFRYVRMRMIGGNSNHVRVLEESIDNTIMLAQLAGARRLNEDSTISDYIRFNKIFVRTFNVP